MIAANQKKAYFAKLQKPSLAKYRIASAIYLLANLAF